MIDGHASCQILQNQVSVRDKLKHYQESPSSYLNLADISPFFAASITCNEDQIFQKMVQVMNTEGTFNNLHYALCHQHVDSLVLLDKEIKMLSGVYPDPRTRHKSFLS